MEFAGSLYGLDSLVTSARGLMQAALGLPFDLARENYATAVRAGLIEKSMLASAKFGRSLNRLEAMTMGPLARSR
jgi:hypothetical protein